MSLETDVQVLTQATTDLLSAVNVKKATLDQSVNDAAAQVSLATTQATNAATSAATATTKAGEAAGSAASALAIYGNTAAQQAAVTAAQNAASVAAGHAASASSVVQQDLSGVNAAALHRSPNAVTAMFVYDTSKDSDGGAWTEKCQHTSWYNEAINGKWLGAQASEAAARAVSGATTGDYFQLTTDGKFYKLNATSGTTEVFRGNKRDFPRLAGIVAEAANVTIYDLTEPGRPMWMRFGNASGFAFTGSAAAVQMLNSVLLVGSNSGLFELDFTKDRSTHRNATSFYLRNVGMALRNAVATFSDFGVAGKLPNSTVYVVAITVLPDAPVDPVTMLQVPTVAVGTQGGLSVIKNDGTVVSATGGNCCRLAIIGSTMWWTGNGWANTAETTDVKVLYDIGKIGSSITASAIYSSSGAVAVPYKPYSFVDRFSNNVISNSSGVHKLKDNKSNKARGTLATITNTFNTGHQVGDIRRCLLSDTSVGSIPGAELVINGEFASASNWALNDASITISGGKLLFTNTPDFKYASQSISATNGQQCIVKITVASITSGALNVQLDGGNGGSIRITQAGTYSYVIPQNPGFNYLYIVCIGASTNAEVESVSVILAEQDRSYKRGGALIAGTLTKTAVASAAQLVAYSGFSASNYLREPYSADLDFGTGEWTASAWVNYLYGNVNANLLTYPEQFDNAAWVLNGLLPFGSGSVANAIIAPDGTTTADFIAETNTTAAHYYSYTNTATPTSANSTASIRVKPNGRTKAQFLLYKGGGAMWAGCAFNLTTNTYNGTPIVSGGGVFISASIVDDAQGFKLLTVSGNPGSGNYFNGILFSFLDDTASETTIAPSYAGDSTKGFYIWGAKINSGTTAGTYTPGQTAVWNPTAPAIERSYSSGAKINLGVDGYGKLTATAYDGTTTRTVTTTAAYNTATWLKVRANYTTDGSLALLVNGQEVAVTRGAPLLTLNNSNAVLTIGNSYAADAPFPGSLALLKLSATVPTSEQSVWMYEQEKQLFRDGAQCCLPDSGAIVDLTYDDATDKWIAVSATNESEWSGLVRTSVTPVPAGSYTKASAASGIQLLARSTTNPGVDITIPAYGLREELVKRAESAARLARSLTTFDYVGGFTASTTNGSTSITSVAGLSYPVSYVGARVTGSGIPTDTVITAVSGTTIYLSKAATATATGVQISFTDFILPVGYEAKAVLSAGSVKTEGSTKDYTRLFDGFRESIRFGTAPGYQAAVQIQATRSAA